MRLVILRSLFVLTAGAGLLIGVLYVASTVDARSPEVLGFALTQAIRDDPDTALITTSIEVTFNEPVAVERGTTAISLSPAVEGTVSWSGSTMTFTPRDPLALETEYVATIGSGIRDHSGNLIASPPRTFAFRTAGRPALVETVPEDGATGIALAEPIRITFSALMDTGSVEGALTIEPAVAHDLRWSGQVLEIAPRRPLAPDTGYEVRIGAAAADVAGVQLGEPIELQFRTVSGGVQPVAVVPADGVDGVAPSGAIAVVFDRGIDPASLADDMLVIDPEVAGALEVVSMAGDPIEEDDPGAGRVVLFRPSGPLPLNTTFEISLAPGLRALDGGLLAEGLAWSFTTGAPAATLSNQISFISARGGIPNVWAMNPDGSGQHQVSTELGGVLDYAVAPDGSLVVISDGRRLISVRADGSARTVLTDDAVLEFDPAFSPDGQRLAFGRADATTGEGLGLWVRAVEGGEATQVDLGGAGPDADVQSPVADEGGAGWLRAPRFSPDGQALAFVDAAGAIAIVELVTGRVTVADAMVVAPPTWLSDSSGILVTHRPGDRPSGPPSGDGRVEPLSPGGADGLAVGLMSRSSSRLRETSYPTGATLVAVDRDGLVAYLDGDGRLHLSEGPRDRGSAARGVGDAIVLGVAFAPGEDAVAIVVAEGTSDERGEGRIELLDLETGQRTVLGEGGAQPTWLP